MDRHAAFSEARRACVGEYLSPLPLVRTLLPELPR